MFNLKKSPSTVSGERFNFRGQFILSRFHTYFITLWIIPLKCLSSSREELFRHASFWWLMIGKINTTQWFLSAPTSNTTRSSLFVIQASFPPAELQFLDLYSGRGTRRNKTISARIIWAWTTFTLRGKSWQVTVLAKDGSTHLQTCSDLSGTDDC